MIKAILYIGSLYFKDEERRVPFRLCPTCVHVIGRIASLTDKYGVSKLSRKDVYTVASEEIVDE